MNKPQDGELVALDNDGKVICYDAANDTTYNSGETLQEFNPSPAELERLELDKIASEVLNELLQEIDLDNKTWGEIIQVDDWIDASDTGTYLSGPQYKTKGKLYQVREVSKREENGKIQYSAIVDGDYLDPRANGKPERVWLTPSNVIVRDKQIIWESALQKSTKHLLNNLRHQLSTEERTKLESDLFNLPKELP